MRFSRFSLAVFSFMALLNVAPAQTITTFAGGGTTRLINGGFAYNAAFYGPSAIAVDSSGNVYVADAGSNGSGGAVVYKISGSVITIIAGTGVSGYSGDGGAATSAEFGPLISGLAVASSGNIYISDYYYSVVRKITASTGVITTFAGKNKTLYGGGYSGDGGLATNAGLYGPAGLAVGSSYLYIADNNNKRVRSVNFYRTHLHRRRKRDGDIFWGRGSGHERRAHQSLRSHPRYLWQSLHRRHWLKQRQQPRSGGRGLDGDY
jgi:hypothetical protein